ncbi:ABC transporter ATP-binding protein [bacterium]|nr:ABC transporter ATP-binding protein [bacterium]
MPGFRFRQTSPVTPDVTRPAPAIHFDNVGFSFPGKTVFSGLNLFVESGLCTCILGPSGCGKSTLLRLISGSAGLTFTGTIRFGDNSRQQGRTAWMAQQDLLLPWMSIRDNVLLGDRLRGTVTVGKRSAANRLLAAAGLEGWGEKLPGVLSGGMRQRVALLRTLMEDRSVILMDEPFSALDALTRIKLQNLTIQLIQGATVLLVTHDPMEALRVADRIYVLSGQPARPGAVITPPGPRPRDVSDAAFARLNAQLLDQLLGEDGP